VFFRIALECLKSPDKDAEAGVHLGVALRPVVDHRLHVGVGRLGVKPHVALRLRVALAHPGNDGTGGIGDRVLAEVHAMDRKAPFQVVVVLLLLGLHDGEMLVEQGVHAPRQRSELQLRNGVLKIVLPVRQGVGLFAFHLIDLVVRA
jgi:hypothetical protein